MRSEQIFHFPTMEEVDSPKFTVNQIMLLQKLKQSGLSKEQILKGLEEIEKLEELAVKSPGLGSTPLHNGTNTAASPDCHSTSNHNHSNGITTNNLVSRENDVPRRSGTPPSPRAKFNHSGVIHPLAPHNPLMFGAHLQNPNQLSILPQVGTWSNSSQAVAVATSLLQNGFGHNGMTSSLYPSLLSGRGILRNGAAGGHNPGSTVVEIDDEKVDITEELEELFRRDQASVKEDIRKFISERHISQSAIAKATKNAISQSYISQWLAQPQDISGQKKRAMYTWYLTERRKAPHGIACPSQSIAYRGNEIEQDSLLMRAKRGARFTWPKECLSILESYYSSNCYPDECKREEIAHACNCIIQSHKPGLILSELDKVTTVKVYNWFANRRKDDKRRRHHIEHVESCSQQQPQPHMVSPRRCSNVSPAPSYGSNDSRQEEDSPMALTEKNTVATKKEDPMTLALEMAAVNHSILSLVNQHHQSPSYDEDDEHDSSFDGAHERANPYQQNKQERLPECRSFAG